LGLIKASKEVNNLIPPPKDLRVFLTVLEVEGGSFTRRNFEDSSEEVEGVHGYSRIRRSTKFKGYLKFRGVFYIGVEELGI